MSCFPFIVGCGRSGTTLLRAMLDSHPDVAVTPESYFVIPTLRDQARYGPPGRFRLSALIDDIVRAESFQEWQLDEEAVRQTIADAAPTCVRDALALLYKYYAFIQGKAIPADKTPYHVRHLTTLAEAFPSARFVHMVRDGRDVVPSIQTAPFGPNRFGLSVLYWKNSVEAGRSAGEALTETRYLEIRYEQLVSTTEQTLRTVCTFLEIEYDLSMLSYHERASAVLAGVRRTKHLQGIRMRPTVGLRDWRASMTARDLKRFEALAGATLLQFGYEPSPVLISTKDRAAAQVVRLHSRAFWRIAKAKHTLGRRRPSAASQCPTRQQQG